MSWGQSNNDHLSVAWPLAGMSQPEKQIMTKILKQQKKEFTWVCNLAQVERNNATCLNVETHADTWTFLITQYMTSGALKWIIAIIQKILRTNIFTFTISIATSLPKNYSSSGNNCLRRTNTDMKRIQL